MNACRSSLILRLHVILCYSSRPPHILEKASRDLKDHLMVAIPSLGGERPYLHADHVVTGKKEGRNDGKKERKNEQTNERKKERKPNGPATVGGELDVS